MDTNPKQMKKQNDKFHVKLFFKMKWTNMPETATNFSFD